MESNRDPERVPEPEIPVTLTEADIESLEIALSKDNQVRLTVVIWYRLYSLSNQQYRAICARFRLSWIA